MHSEHLRYLDNVKPGIIVTGEEFLMKDYITVSKDPKSNLPEQFTICSSVFMGRIVNLPNVFQLLNEKGKHWFNLNIRISDSLREVFNKKTKFKVQTICMQRHPNFCFYADSDFFLIERM